MKNLIASWLLIGTVISSSPGSSVELNVDRTPLGRVGSALHLQETKTICLELSRELSTDWPVHNAAANWNKNGLNLFTFDATVKCDGVVLVTESDTKQWWGSTEFYSRDLINVQFSTAAPRNRYPAIVCHELGHVLGLPHSSGDGSCMDHNQNNPEPTKEDLANVSTNSWSASVARNRMLGVK
jgi:hypothetical protein